MPAFAKGTGRLVTTHRKHSSLLLFSASSYERTLQKQHTREGRTQAIHTLLAGPVTSRRFNRETQGERAAKIESPEGTNWKRGGFLPT